MSLLESRAMESGLDCMHECGQEMRETRFQSSFRHQCMPCCVSNVNSAALVIRCDESRFADRLASLIDKKTAHHFPCTSVSVADGMSILAFGVIFHFPDPKRTFSERTSGDVCVCRDF